LGIIIYYLTLGFSLFSALILVSFTGNFVLIFAYLSSSFVDSFLISKFILTVFDLGYPNSYKSPVLIGNYVLFLFSSTF